MPMSTLADRTRRRSRLLAGAAALLLSAVAGQSQLMTEDGLRLDLDETGTVRSCRIDGREQLRVGERGGLFVADVAGVPAREVNVLANPSFEDVRAGVPVGWTTGGGWSVDTEVRRSGQTSMRVRVPGTEKRSTGDLAVEIPVRPNTPYRVSGWLRTDGAAPHLYILELDADGKPHRDYPQLCVSHSRRQSGWFELGRSFTTSFFCRRIRLRTNIWQQTGTAWVDDVSLVCLDDEYVSPQRLAEGTVRRAASRMEQVSEFPGQGLRLKTTYHARPDCIVVDGAVEDTSGSDRAIAVSFRLPLGGPGWTWFDDIRNEQDVEDGVRCGAARLLGAQDGAQRRTIGLYPFASMGDGTAALALAVPMDMPRAFRLCYDPALGFFVSYEFGLTRAATKHPGRAWFRLFVYRIDPAWGFRSAAAKYYASHPEYFVKRAPREGPIGSMADCDATDAVHPVVPAFADFSWHRRQLVDGNRRELADVLRYTEFIGWWGWALGIKPEQAEDKPAPAEAWAHVEELAHRDPPADVARCILNCALHDRDGNRRLHRSYVPKWGGYNYLCNPDPEVVGIGGEVNRFTLTYAREVAEVDTFKLDGMRYDNPVVFATDNFRREHFRWADHPLVFDHVSKKPVIPLDFSSYECARAIADDMHGRGKLVGSNYTPAGHPSDIFRIQLLDVIGSETLWTWPTNAKFLLQRTLAGQKTVSMSWQEAKKSWAPARVEREMKQAMFFGTFYHLSTMDPAVYRRWQVLTARLANAGWEPVTHVRCESRGSMVERFGCTADRDLHFTLRNETDREEAVEVRLDAEALELTATPDIAAWLVRDPEAIESRPLRRGGEHWSLTLSLPPRDTLVLRLATPYGLALDHLFVVPDHLRRAANYRDALKAADVEVIAPDYARIEQQTAEAVTVLRTRGADPDRARSALQALSDALSAPEARGEARGHAIWATRLQANTATARSALKRAAAALHKERP